MTDLKAGRKLDAKVAEQVMGWYVKDVVPEDDYAIGCPPERYEKGAPQMDRQHVPHYSTDIAAAWQVVEHMQAQGWSWEVLNTTDTKYGAVFCQTPDDVYGADADTVPLAICLAVLKAVERHD